MLLILVEVSVKVACLSTDCSTELLILVEVSVKVIFVCVCLTVEVSVKVACQFTTATD